VPYDMASLTPSVVESLGTAGRLAIPMIHTIGGAGLGDPPLEAYSENNKHDEDRVALMKGYKEKEIKKARGKAMKTWYERYNSEYQRTANAVKRNLPARYSGKKEFNIITLDSLEAKDLKGKELKDREFRMPTLDQIYEAQQRGQQMPTLMQIYYKIRERMEEIGLRWIDEFQVYENDEILYHHYDPDVDILDVLDNLNHGSRPPSRQAGRLRRESSKNGKSEGGGAEQGRQ